MLIGGPEYHTQKFLKKVPCCEDLVDGGSVEWNSLEGSIKLVAGSYLWIVAVRVVLYQSLNPYSLNQGINVSCLR